MDKINKLMMESFKSVFDVILKEAENKVRVMGYDPNSKEGKALISTIYKKVLGKIGIDLEKYTIKK